MADPPAALYLHIGLQKTGTSYLQRIFWDSVAQLHHQGVDLVPGSKLAMFRLMLDVRGRLNPEIDPPAATRSLERLPGQLAAAGPVALISQESLATAGDAQITRFLAATGDREVHLIVTLRDIGRQIPSAWQQTLQSGRSQRLRPYLRRLERACEPGARAWATMDSTAILQRWGAHVPAERIHVVTVPPSGAPPHQLLHRFCSVIGVDPENLVIDESARGNRSLRAEQAEVLRRVNAVLPPEFKRRDTYGDLGKRYFAVEVLGTDAGTPIRLPGPARAWCTARAQGFIDHIAGGGYDIVGDLDDLLPLDDAFTGTTVRNRDVTTVAAQALADMLVDKMHERRGSAAAAGHSPATSAGHSAVAALRTRAARLRDRIAARRR